MHNAVDFDNALELAHRMDNGGVDETKELAKGTAACGGQSVQGPALDEVLVDDGVHAVGQLSGRASARRDGHRRREALYVLDGVLQILSIVEVLHRENLAQTLLVRCKLRRGDDGGHCHYERRGHRLRMELGH